MKKIIAPKPTKLIYTLKGLMIPFVFIVLLFASCSKEDGAVPQQPMADQSAQSAIANSNGAGMNQPMLTLPSVPAIPPNALIFISHGACLGNCPVYTVTITNDGDVIYNGKGNVVRFGEYHYKVDGNKLYQLQLIMALNGFTEMQNYYPYVTDMPQTVTALHSGVTYKVVVDYCINAPKELASMRESIEAMVGVNHLVNGGTVERIWLDNDNR